MSGKRDSNSRPRPWQGRALPTELFPLRRDKSKTFFDYNKENERKNVAFLLPFQIFKGRFSPYFFLLLLF